MPASWLLKSEPSVYSFDDLVREKRAVWDGIRNPTALMHLRAMRSGDRILFYHTGGERAVVGRAKVLAGPYPDPRAGDPKLVVVDLAPVRRWKCPVGLEAIRGNPRLSGWELLRIGRLSVVPVSAAHWNEVLAMAGEARG